MKNQTEKEIIKEALEKRAENIKPRDEIFYNIREGIYQKEEKKMKGFKKVIFGGCVAAVLLTSVAFGAGKIKYKSSSSDTREAITHVPTEKELKDLAGYVPKFTETMGGLKLDKVQPSNSSEEDEDGNVVNRYKSIEFYYETKNKGEILSLHTDPTPLYDDITEYEAVPIGDITAYYSHFTYMAAPPDYVPTEEEKAAEERGELQIGYGSRELEVTETNSIIWYDDGISYDLLNMGMDFDKEDLKEMAEAVINS